MSFSPSSDHRLWDYALGLYAQPAIADSCLYLQDTYDANVNLLLFTLWLEHCNILLTQERLSLALVRIQNWDLNYVQPLRNLRRAMKRESELHLTSVEEVREQIKCAELSAEKYEHELLESLAMQWQPEQYPDADVAAGKNLTSYLNHLQLPDAVIIQIQQVFHQKEIP